MPLNFFQEIFVAITLGEATNEFKHIKKITNTEDFKKVCSKLVSSLNNIPNKKFKMTKMTNLRSLDSVRVALVFIEVYNIIKTQNISNPQEIAERILTPSLEIISENKDIENNEQLRKKWAYLLAHGVKGKEVSKLSQDTPESSS